MTGEASSIAYVVCVKRGAEHAPFVRLNETTSTAAELKALLESSPPGMMGDLVAVTFGDMGKWLSVQALATLRLLYNLERELKLDDRVSRLIDARVTLGLQGASPTTVAQSLTVEEIRTERFLLWYELYRWPSEGPRQLMELFEALVTAGTRIATAKSSAGQ
ncbi:MAG: hypothetical protein IPJ68_05830 [Candidatus Moraniibacteriota bacterium]|nr:MAG: hypothetical protein IPJ68_05830 [Candidatus Moranbacteria bacterium]